jgi:hypothetical protein
MDTPNFRAAILASEEGVIDYPILEAPVIHLPDSTTIHWTCDLDDIKKIAARTREAIGRDREIIP